MVLEALEILVEHVDEALGRLPEGRFVLPGLDRVEDMRLDARDGGWHRESEIRVAAEISPVERAVERGGEKATRDPDRHAAAGAVLSAGPSGVHEPAIDR